MYIFCYLDKKVLQNVLDVNNFFTNLNEHFLDNMFTS